MRMSVRRTIECRVEVVRPADLELLQRQAECAGTRRQLQPPLLDLARREQDGHPVQSRDGLAENLQQLRA